MRIARRLIWADCVIFSLSMPIAVYFYILNFELTPIQQIFVIIAAIIGSFILIAIDYLINRALSLRPQRILGALSRGEEITSEESAIVHRFILSYPLIFSLFAFLRTVTLGNIIYLLLKVVLDISLEDIVPVEAGFFIFGIMVAFLNIVFYSLRLQPIAETLAGYGMKLIGGEKTPRYIVGSRFVLILLFLVSMLVPISLNAITSNYHIDRLLRNRLIERAEIAREVLSELDGRVEMGEMSLASAKELAKIRLVGHSKAEGREVSLENRVGDTGFSFIIDMQGKLIAHPTKEGEIIVGKLLQEMPTLKDNWLKYIDRDRNPPRRRLVAYRYYPSWDWIVAYEGDIQEMNAETSGIKLSSLLMVLLGVGSMSAIAYAYASILSLNMIRLITVAQNISEGDLRVEIPLASMNQREMLVLYEATSRIRDSLSRIVRQINSSSSQVADTADELSGSSQKISEEEEDISESIQQIASGVSQQFTEAAKVASFSSEVVEAANQVLGSAEHSERVANDIAEIASQGESLASEALMRINAISTASSSTVEAVGELDERSRMIGKIVEAISNISKQTNMLALNAAIEAARAGEAGRGFAVVAEEVGNLSKRTSKALTEINDLIEEIQVAIARTVGEAERVSEEVAISQQVINEASNSLQNIAEQVEGAVSAGHIISTAAKSQQDDMEQLSASLKSMATLAEANAAESQEASASLGRQTSALFEMASSAQKLAEMADELRKTIEKFKI